MKPHPEPYRLRCTALSAGTHLVLVVFLLLLPKSSRPPRAVAVDRAVDVVFVKPDSPAPPPEPVMPPPPTPKFRPMPEPEPAPRAAVPPPPRPPEPAPAPPKVAVAKVERPTPPPPPARKPVVGAFADAPASAPPALARRTAVASAGFEVAAAIAAPSPAPRAAVPVGFGAENGPSAVPSRATRTVATAGFESDVAPAARPVARTAVAQAASFDAPAEPPAPKAKRRLVGSLDAPVEILSKPRPTYTEQARRLRIEGEVVLAVVFFSDGKIAVVRVVEGLGHGLDEAAVEAAKKIEFAPARREGRPVDHEATLRIVFKLA